MSGDILSAARSWVGTPYQHQGSLKGVGTDCLGLILGVWREIGGGTLPDIPPYAPSWHVVDPNEDLWAAMKTVLQPADRVLAPGDIALLRMRDGASARHAGIISGTWREPRLIHAYSGRGVVESFLGKPFKRRIVARFRFPKE